MSLRLITGSSGQGKTEYIIRDMIRRSEEEPDRMFYLIVPEQAGSSMEQRILSINKERTGRDGFFNIDII